VNQLVPTTTTSPSPSPPTSSSKVTTSILTSTTTPQQSSSATTSSHQSSGTGTFTYDTKTFYVNGKAFQIIGGQIDPQRVPKEYWAQRIQMAKSMGLNTIFSYLFWHYIEPHQGTFNFTGINDIASFYQAVQDAGMMAVLRPGPYVTAERDWGGLPGWLSQIPNMKTRANNGPFLNATAAYFNAVGQQLRPYLVSNGGPIMMAQIENEYGYIGSDMNYKQALSNQMASAFPNTKQYTNDCNSVGCLQGGAVPGALAVVDGTDPRTGFTTRNQAITIQSEQGPLMDGEYWVTWFDAWGPKNGHTGYNNGASTLDWILSNGNHFSIYMFHGGGSFPFGAGSGGPNPLQPFTTSYDYGAPLDESGRPSPIYSGFRSTIVKYNPSAPSVPSLPSLQSIPQFSLTPVAGLFDSLPQPITSSSPQVMEALGQCFGYIL
jgi:beta-galactosidase GanA